jgi:tetratricopeptide (TPR) repeat protein
MPKPAGTSKGADQGLAADENALRQGMAAMQDRRAGDAERIARDVIARRPQHAGALHLLGMVLLTQQRPQDAVAPLQAAARASGDPAVETHLAFALRNAGQLVAARAALERATTRQPPYAPAFLELGTLLRKQHRFSEAQIVLKRGLEVAPSMPEMSMMLGGVLLDRADAANAKVAFARALANAPGHPDALLGFGIALLYEGEFARAAERFRQIVARDPNHVRGRLNLGSCLLELGQWDEGIGWLRETVKLDPTSAPKVMRTLVASARGRFWLKRSDAVAFLGLTEAAPPQPMDEPPAKS